MEIEQAIVFCDKLIKHYKNKKIVIEFTGGETTMWKDLITLCKYLHTSGVAVSLISNGSRTTTWWQKILPYLSRVNLSFHPEHADPEHFLSIIHTLHQSVQTHVNVMMLPDQFDKCIEFTHQIVQNCFVTISTQPLLYNLNGSIFPYTEAQLKILNGDEFKSLVSTNIQHEYYRGEMTKEFADGRRENYSCTHFLSSFENNWRGWNCTAGLEQLVVTSKGEIFRGWCMNGGMIGTISDPEINFPNTTVFCNNTRCNCNFDILCTKYK